MNNEEVVVEQQEPVQEQAPAEQPAAEQVEEQQPVQAEAPKPKKGLERRFHDLTSKIKEKEEALRQREAEIQRLREIAEKSEESKNKPKPGGVPNPENYQTMDEYISAKARYEAEQYYKAQTERQRLEAIERERAERVRAFKKQELEAMQIYEDYDEVVYGEPDHEVILSRDLQEAIMDSDKNAHLLYYLAKNPDETKRLSLLDGHRLGREIAKLEFKLEAPTKAARNISSAPNPINTAKVAKKAATAPINYETMSADEYIAARNRERLQKYGRL